VSTDEKNIARWGRDRLVRKEAQRIIYSPADMEDWEVRKFRRVLIRIEGHGYHLTRKTRQPGGLLRYLLEPWPEDYPDPPAIELTYDRDYVEARDRVARASFRREVGLGLLWPLIPLIGLLPAGSKARLHARYGVHPQTATAWSLWLEWALILFHVLLLAIQTWTGIFNTGYIVAVLLVLAPDVLVRWSSLLGEEINPYGFYEWLFRLRLR
jgi:hypothetical protein